MKRSAASGKTFSTSISPAESARSLMLSAPPVASDAICKFVYLSRPLFLLLTKQKMIASLDFETFPVSPSDELIGFLHVGDPHVLAIQEKFLPSEEFHLSAAVLAPEQVTPNGQITHQNGLGHR